MNCKDCLHYEACKGTYYTAKGCDNIALYDFDGEMYADSGCEYFTARSEWVHLPCKVGDNLYKVVPDFEKPIGSLKIQEYMVTGFIANALITRPYNVFGVHRIGNDVFLTHEEAEKALEGMK